MGSLRTRYAPGSLTTCVNGISYASAVVISKNPTSGTLMSLDELTIATADIALEIGVRDGVWLNRIVDLRAQREWLGSPTSLFAFKVHGQWYDSSRALVVDHAP